MALTTSQILAGYGITLQQAHDWVLARLANPQAIVDAAHAAGLTNAQLGEIAGGVSAADVQAFFGTRGIDTSSLDASAPAHFALPDNLSALASLVVPDTYSGGLSTASLHTRVVAATGASAYTTAFPDASFESEFYGTIIHALKAIDLTEAAQIASFAQAHASQFATNPLGVLTQASDLLVSVLTTPARLPVVSDSLAADAAVTAATYFVQLAGQGNGGAALLEGLFGAVGH